MLSNLMIIQRNFKQINNLLTSKRFIWLIPVDSFLFKLNSTYPMESETNVVFDSFWLKIPAMGRKFLEKGRSSFFRWTIHSVKCVVYRLNELTFLLGKAKPVRSRREPCSMTCWFVSRARSWSCQLKAIVSLFDWRSIKAQGLEILRSIAGALPIAGVNRELACFKVRHSLLRASVEVLLVSHFVLSWELFGSWRHQTQANCASVDLWKSWEQHRGGQKSLEGARIAFI